MISMERLTERQKRVLEAVIGEHIRCAEPVGSRTLSRKYLRLSPATVRNVLADLEEMGLLSQPHTSAGRVPTERAYRMYIDGMMHVRPLTLREQDRIRADFESRRQDGRDLMKRTSQLLSAFSNQVGSSWRRLDEAGLKRVELVRAGKGRVLAVIISDRPLVHHRIVASEMDPTQVELDQMSRALNEILSGLNLRQVRARIEEEMRDARTACDRVLAAALRLGREPWRIAGNDCTWRSGGSSTSRFLDGSA
jgi:heat-inducible transcriptional repressor